MKSTSDIQLIIQVARMYNERNMTQQEIAKRLNITRQKVSRLLGVAREEGIVRISILDPTPCDTDLQKKLEQNFHLSKVILVRGDGLETDAIRSVIGMAAADYLHEDLNDNELIGIGWGRTMSEVVKSVSSNKRANIHVVPLVGGVGNMSPSFQVNEITHKLADAFGGTFRNLYAPVFTESHEAWKVIVSTSEVQEVADLWPKMDRSLVGVGHFGSRHLSSMYFGNHVFLSMMAPLAAKGAVGDICGHYFDLNGNPISIDSGVISISLDQLRTSKKVTAVAGGLEKVQALLGALRGGYIKILITDSVTAQKLFEEM